MSIAKGDGFKNDLLGRREFGERLTNLVLAIGGPSTLLLDGPWGSGKTTFVQMWADTLRSKGSPVIYFNAFDNDYLNDAFTALAGEFVAAETQPDARERLVGAAVKIGKTLAIHGSRYAVKAATLGAVDLLELHGAVADIAKDVAKDIGKDSGEAASAMVKEKLSARKAERSAMEQFRNELATFVSGICEKAEADQSAPPAPLVFIIDELDRCKPDFALSLVEGVKHLFAVPDVVFLLVTNLDQMCCAVRATYGPSIDARGYLEKFYHLILALPEPDRLEGPSNLERFLAGIFSGLPSDVSNNNPQIRWGTVHQSMTQHLLLLNARKGLSLRKLERLATRIAVVYASTRDSQLRVAPIIADLCLMKADAPDLYRSARDGTLTVSRLESFIPYSEWAKADSENVKQHAIWAANFWRYVLGEELLGDMSKQIFDDEFGRYMLRNPRRVVPMTCDWIDGFSFPTSA
jgi:hypothetical protein